jgi:DNA-directed RNA polymerase delta subunit
MAKIQKLNIKNIVAKFLASIPPKNREVIERRFGIGRDSAETLESVGRSYGITRERVRQIQEYGMKRLMTKSGAPMHLSGVFMGIEEYIKSKDGVARESDLFETLAKQDESAYLALVLRLMPNIVIAKETDDLHARYAISKDALAESETLVTNVHAALAKQGKPISFSDLTKLANENILSLSKRIKKSPFGNYGLSMWPSITPRGVRDRAHLVFEREGKPLHFKEMSSLIDKYFGNGSLARATHPQTVHNELIKDPRFVLIGRGLYALAEWGYEAGTVKDVLVQILKNQGKPMYKEEILGVISEKRFVKPNTIFLNLQNRNYFKKVEGDKYYLA